MVIHTLGPTHMHIRVAFRVWLSGANHSPHLGPGLTHLGFRLALIYSHYKSQKNKKQEYNYKTVSNE